MWLKKCNGISSIGGIFWDSSGYPCLAFSGQISATNALETEAQALLEGLKTVLPVQPPPIAH